jgi:hypothetical protein
MRATTHPQPTRLVGPPTTELQESHALAALNRLDQYRSYLKAIRAAKAKVTAQGLAVTGFDSAAVANGQRALGDIQAVAAATATLATHEHLTGALQTRVEAMHRALHASGPVRMCDVWSWVHAQTGAEAALRKIGINTSMLHAIDDNVGAYDVTAATVESRITLRGTLSARDVDVAMTANPLPTSPSNLTDALSRGRSERLADMLARGEPTYLNSVPSVEPDGAVRPYDMVIHAAGAFVREGVGHVRRLEDAGLTTYNGADPGTIIIVSVAIGLGLLVAGVVTGLICEGSSGHDQSHHPVVCVISDVLFVLGLWALGLAFHERVKENGGYYLNDVWVHVN